MKSVEHNRKDWLERLDDTMWAYQTAYKTPIRTAPYKLVHWNACHLPMEHEHKAYLAIKALNFDIA